MASATSYNTTNREDISDAITLIEPEDTPLLSMLPKKKKPVNPSFQWPVDKLDAVDAATVGSEGSDFSTFDNPAENRAFLSNQVQRNEATWQVSDLQAEMDAPGISDEASNAKSHKLRELKRNMEARIGSDYDRVNTGPSYQTRGLGTFIDSSGPSDVDADFRTPSGSINATAQASLTETLVGDVITSIYTQGGKARSYKLVCGTSLKRAISNFSRATGAAGTTKTYQVTQSAESKKITLNVEIYEGDFGTLDLIPDLFLGHGASSTTTIRAMRGYVIATDLVGIRYVTSPTHVDLPDEGGGQKGGYKVWWGLECNPLGLGKFNATA
jgi:hypothetical protein